MSELKVLIVEDDPVSAKKLEHDLVNLGASVKLFSNGTDALDHLNYNRGYELLIVDLKLPDMSGIQFIRSFRQSNITTNIIIISGTINREIFQKTYGLGIEDILVKPYDLERLKRHII